MSLQSRVIQSFSRIMIKRSGLDQEATVNHLRLVFNNTPRVTLLPRNVRIERINTAEYRGEVISVKDPEYTVLYFHGGAFVAGKTRTYHNFASRLAIKLNANVYLATYPFAPERPYPAATDQCFAAYQFLVEQGINPAKIVLAGDSAGGGLALSVLLQIKHHGLQLPLCTVGLSPATNCLPDHAVIERYCNKDSMLSADIVKKVIDLYVPDESLRQHPFASPVNGDFHGLPPLMITIGNGEVLYEDALTLRRRAEAAGVKVKWLERSKAFHVWPIMTPFVPEANQDLKRIVSFIQTCDRNNQTYS